MTEPKDQTRPFAPRTRPEGPGIEPGGGPLRVAIVVDHPMRDLPALTLIAASLCRQGVAVFLVPFNLAAVELWRLVPDFVLLNYFRKNQLPLYERLMAAHIPCGVLDTEGGVMESTTAYTDLLVDDEHLRSYLKCYCCWGPKIAQHLVDEGYFSAEQVQVTGCPRTDVYVPPMRHSVAAHAPGTAGFTEDLILVSGNFSLGNPGLQTPEQQFKLLVDDLKLAPEKARRWQQNEWQGLHQMAELANQLAVRFPSSTVVYRPHPFERMETYGSLLQDHANLHCVREGTVDGWILNAKVVVHRACTTAIEASMSGVPVVSASWISTAFERQNTEAVSVQCASSDELLSAVGTMLASEYERSADLEQNIGQVIGDWFFKVDGHAHQRVAEVILKHTSAEDRQRRWFTCRDAAYGLDQRRKGSRRWLGRYVKAALNLPPNWSYLTWRAKPIWKQQAERWDTSNKSFALPHVEQLAGLITDGTCRVEVPPSTDSALPASGYNFHFQHGRSIALTRRAA